MMGNGECKCVLCPVSFGVGLGIASALFMLAYAWAGWLGGYATQVIDLSSTVHAGYAPTFIGGLVGAVWGFIEGFIFGFIAVFFYNKCLRCCGRSGTCDPMRK